MDVQNKIFEQVSNHEVVLYMKGTPQLPQCGFSSLAVEILKRCEVDDFLAVNVLEDADVRQGIKTYASWPTIPQLYVRGEFVGGADIMRELYQSGELRGLLAGGDSPSAAPPAAPSG
jgi:monothiol glutaredoxin